MSRRIDEYDPATGEVRVGNRWYDSRDAYEDAAADDAESRRELEFEREDERE